MASILVFVVLVPIVIFVQSEPLQIRRAVMPSWASGVRLDGSRTTYAQFSPWSICRNASLSFDFQTGLSTALLVYADDGHRFVQVRLVRGALQLRYRLWNTTEYDTITMVGDGLADGRWHSVRLWSDDGSRLVLTVDGVLNVVPRAEVDAFVRRRADTVLLTTGTFVGGLPVSVRRRPGDLAVPTVAFELRLDGYVRNFRLSHCSALSTAGTATLAKLVSGRGMTPADRRVDDRCETDNPCLHGGICVNTDAGPLCECDRTDFDGMRCNIGLLCSFFCYIVYLTCLM